MKKNILILLVILFTTSIMSAQYESYDDAIGIRGGLHSGITYKRFISSSTAIEGILHTRWRGWEVVGLMEFHNELSPDNLSWFYGYGGHLGFYDTRYTYWDEPSGSVLVAGVDGILGVEYQFDEVPFVIGVDWKPYLNLLGHSGFFANGGAFFVRYVF